MVELLENGTMEMIEKSSYSEAQYGKNVGNSDREKLQEEVDTDLENGKREKPRTGTMKALNLNDLFAQEKEVKRIVKKMLKNPHIKKIVLKEALKSVNIK